MPDVRGYQTAYARAALDQAHCRLGSLRRERGAGSAGVVISERPAPGTRAPARQPVSLVVGPRPRGCAQERYQMLERTSELRVWLGAEGDPDEGLNEPKPWRIALQACRPPSGPVVTMWSISSEEAIQDSSVYSDLRVLGTVVAFVVTDSSQYGGVETLEVRDLSRRAPGAGCPRGNQLPAARYCLLTALVGVAGEPSGVQAPVNALSEYAIDSLGNVAWVRKVGPTETLYLSTPLASRPIVIEVAAGIGDVALAGGVLSWSSGVQQHSETVLAATT